MLDFQSLVSDTFDLAQSLVADLIDCKSPVGRTPCSNRVQMFESCHGNIPLPMLQSPWTQKKRKRNPPCFAFIEGYFVFVLFFKSSLSTNNLD